jgi:Fe-S-cluster containining protein
MGRSLCIGIVNYWEESIIFAFESFRNTNKSTVMHIETDLDTIKRNAGLREDQNYRFRTYLKGQDGDRLDKQVHELYDLVVKQIDCTQCANCCIVLDTSFKMDEIDRLAGAGIIEKESFIAESTVPVEEVDEEEEQEIFLLKDRPCQFLKDKKCTIFPLRPDLCKDYPYLHKDEIVHRLFGVISNYEICPIVYNVFELLKERYRKSRF